MNFWGKLALAASVAWVSNASFAMTDPAARVEPQAAPAPTASFSALAGVEASDDARYVEQWIHAKGDAHGMPFAIVDKKAARIFVFGAHGQLVGTSSTILGQARGDVPVPGAGQKDPSRLLPYERKTPAGRFESQPGRNLSGEPVVWVDYDTGIAIHRVRPGKMQATRLHNLATDGTDDKRMSLGCVVLPESFFLQTVLPTLGHSHAVVYVLPEDGPVEAMFGNPMQNVASARKVAAVQNSAR